MSEPTTDANPLLCFDGLPRFDEIRPEHIQPAVRQMLADAEQQLTSLESDAAPTWNDLVEPLSRMDLPFELSWGAIGHLQGVANSPELRKEYEAVLPDVVKFRLRAGQSRALYDALKAIRDGDNWNQLNEAQQRIVDAKLLSAELSGVGLEGPDKERFNEIAQELSQLGNDFSNHVLDATKAWFLDLSDPADVEGFPDSLKQLCSQAFNQDESHVDEKSTPEAGPWRVTLDLPCFMAFMKYCANRELRETVYRAFTTRASSGELDNSGIIERTLELRQEEARLLGYATYAEMSLATKMAPDVAAVEEMFQTLRTASFDAARQDLAEIAEIAVAAGAPAPLAHWDVPYWSERLREQRFEYTDEQLRPYFPLEHVLDGMFELVNRLFGITVRAADGKAPVWHKDVRYFEVFDESDSLIAGFYLDPYSRPENKRGGAWMNDCRGRRIVDGQVLIPVAHLICNGTPPVGDKPALMTFREVETLFHEFGHGLQHLLTRVDYADAAGINNVEWDAVELPSQFMENWCYHRPTLMGITAHYETGEPLPEDLFEKICAARTFRAGSMMLRQLAFGMTDMELHDRFQPGAGKSVFDVQMEVLSQTSVIPPLPDDRSLCAFQHIFAGGYAAGYYSYKWAEVLSADAFAAFEEAGLDNEQAVAETGRRFRDTVLALGGGRHPMQVFRDFRGRDPEPTALLRHSGLL